MLCGPLFNSSLKVSFNFFIQTFINSMSGHSIPILTCPYPSNFTVSIVGHTDSEPFRQFIVYLYFVFSNGTWQSIDVFWVAISASCRFISDIKHSHLMIINFRLIMGFYKFLDPWYGCKKKRFLF